MIQKIQLPKSKYSNYLKIAKLFIKNLKIYQQKLEKETQNKNNN